MTSIPAANSDVLSYNASRDLSVIQREDVAYDITKTLQNLEGLCCLPNQEGMSGEYYDNSRDVRLSLSLKRQPRIGTEISGTISLREGSLRRSISREPYLPTWNGLKDNSDIIAMLGVVANIKESPFFDMTSITDQDIWGILSEIPNTTKAHRKDYFYEILNFLGELDMITQLTATGLYAKSPKTREFYKEHGHRRTHENFSLIKIQRILQKCGGPNGVKENIKACVNNQSGEIDLVSSVSPAQSNEHRIQTDPEELVFQVTEACKLLLKTIPVENDPLALL